MEQITTLILSLLSIFLILFIFFLRNFKYCVKTIRQIAHNNNRGGYLKIIQIGFLVTLILVFIGILVYYMINGMKVSSVDVVLTVVVGWLGLIIGRFFGEDSMFELQERQKIQGNQSIYFNERLLNQIEENKLFFKKLVK